MSLKLYVQYMHRYILFRGVGGSKYGGANMDVVNKTLQEQQGFIRATALSNIRTASIA